jgi:hypothetical protein
MNERIRSLAIQANPASKDIYMVESSWPYNCAAWSGEDLHEFAELIVRECLGIVDNAERGGSNDIWDNAVKFIRRDLQEHFGVE